MKNRHTVHLIHVAWVVLLIALPLLGACMGGLPVNRFLEFPPLTRYVQHPGFSWPVFLGLLVLSCVVVLPFLLRVLRTEVPFPGGRDFGEPRPGGTPGPTSAHTPPLTNPQTPHAFPSWGWAGVGFLALSWVLAWTRFPWFAALQRFTFTPLWFGYVIVVNALCKRRTGHCMLTDRPGYTLRLFAVSAAFWWFFEYLNRFVQNWYYVEVGQLTPLQYLLFATLPFSTVLPAVLGTYEFLDSFPRLTAGLTEFLPLRVSRPRLAGALALATFCMGLACLPLLPEYLFPMLWVSPLFIIVGFQAATGRRTIFARVSHGDWRELCLLALSALVCGIFWEMWNFHSLARWEYSVPFVHAFKVFEMPVLGYAGYLPFGLECAVVAKAFAGETIPP